MIALIAALYLIVHELRCTASEHEECIRCSAPAPVIIFFAACDAAYEIYSWWQTILPAAGCWR